MTTTPLPEEIELHRDRMWRRDEDLRVERAVDAERFIEDVGFANTLTDARRAGPSLYIAVCGRRDVSLPRTNHGRRQKDEETRLTWYLKDEVMRRGRLYYAKLAGSRSMFVAPRLISHFATVWMPRRKDEPQLLSTAAQRVLKVLRREHELATADLRAESGVTERAAFTRALDELQRQMKVIPQDVIYQPTFSYIWMLAEDRFPEELRKRVARKTALREIARAYLEGAGMSLLGETARASGLSRVEAGLGNHQLVDEGYAIRLRQGIYVLASSARSARQHKARGVSPGNRGHKEREPAGGGRQTLIKMLRDSIHCNAKRSIIDRSNHAMIFSNS
ncbi:MAG: AlkZ-related protein [Pyrinomonadaceae bacterium]